MDLTSSEARRTVHQRIVTELSPAPVASSVHRPWSGMTVQLHDWHSGGSVASPVVDHDLIAMRVTGSVKLTQRRVGTVHRDRATPGNVTIHPRGFESRWSWDRPGAIVVVRVSQEVLAEAADSAVNRSQFVELRNCFGERDAFIEPILNLFAHELRQPAHPVQELIAGSLSCALAVHLVQRFNVRPTVSVADSGRLAPQALRRVLEFMHTSAAAPVTVSALAEIAGVSRFHFARMFRRTTGEGPVGYLKRIRPARARETIASNRRTSKPIATTAAPPGGLAHWQVKRVTAHMLDHLDRDIGLNELAKLVNLSRFHFCTAFRLTIGQTPRQWLIEKRIDHARTLLADRTLSITEIALAVGYTTPSAFATSFRWRIGMTPSAFRRAL
jgi:AraC family transcriptional regulator